MSKKIEDIEVDGTRYSCGQYSAGKAVRLLAKLVKIAGKPFGLLVGSGVDADMKPDLIASALEALGSAAEPEEFEKLIKEILEGTIIFTDSGNRPVVFDTDFSGRIGHLFKVIRQILTFQYGDFLGVLAVAAPAPAASQSQGRVRAL